MCVGEDGSAGRRLGEYFSCTGIDTSITGRLSLVFDFISFFKGAHVNGKSAPSLNYIVCPLQCGQ